MKPPNVDQLFWCMWMRRAWEGRSDNGSDVPLHIESAARLHHVALEADPMTAHWARRS
jgi:hypothetical protein